MPRKFATSLSLSSSKLWSFPVKSIIGVYVCIIPHKSLPLLRSAAYLQGECIQGTTKFLKTPAGGVHN